MRSILNSTVTLVLVDRLAKRACIPNHIRVSFPCPCPCNPTRLKSNKMSEVYFRPLGSIRVYILYIYGFVCHLCVCARRLEPCAPCAPCAHEYTKRQTDDGCAPTFATSVRAARSKASRANNAAPTHKGFPRPRNRNRCAAPLRERFPWRAQHFVDNI